MASTKISALTQVSSVAGSNEFAVNDGGLSRKASGTQIAAYVSPAASDTVPGIIEIADQTEQKAGSDNTKAVTSGRQAFHPSAAKFWAAAQGATTTMDASFNMTSWAHTATGDVDGTIATDFSSADWCGITSIRASALRMSACTSALNSQCASYGFDAQAADSFGILCSRMTGNGTAAAALMDPDEWFVIGFGDQ